MNAPYNPKVVYFLHSLAIITIQHTGMEIPKPKMEIPEGYGTKKLNKWSQIARSRVEE